MNKIKNKKFHKKFIICICCLILAILTSLIYLLAAINNKLETTKNTSSPTASVILFSSFLILPPLIWLTILILTKQVVFNIEVEKERANRKFDNSKLKIINSIVEKYQKNTNLIKILKNYCLSHKIPMWELEFACIPLNRHISYRYSNATKTRNEMTYYKIDKWINYLENDSDYINFIKNFTQEIIDYNSNLVDDAYRLRCGDYVGLLDKRVQSFTDIYNLFNSLQDQKIIEIDKYQYLAYYAFLFTLYRSAKMNFYDLAVKRFEIYDVDINEDIKSVVRKLYENDLEEELITTTLWALDSNRNKYNDLLCITYNKFSENVKHELLDIQEKEKIEGLLNYKQSNMIYSIDTLDLMSGQQFESFVTYLFNRLGYKATTTKLSGDQGIDVIAVKGKTKIAIQTKCYSRPVGNHAVMEAVAGAKYYKADKVMVVTNNTFTKSARELSESNGVILWDRNILKEKLEQI